MPAYYFNLDEVIVKGDDRSITLTFSDTAGDPVDISAWTFYYAADERNGTGAITVADGSMTKSDSGRGVTDTVTIPRADTVTNVTVGFWDHDIAVKDASDEITTIAKGVLTIVDRETTVA